MTSIHVVEARGLAGDVEAPLKVGAAYALTEVEIRHARDQVGLLAYAVETMARGLRREAAGRGVGVAWSTVIWTCGRRELTGRYEPGSVEVVAD